jgi:uncharacterized protein YdhG (YjbR/CyaY superfamily)
LSRKTLWTLPYSETIVEFSEKLEGYETSKGTVKFPHGKKLPKKLIAEMVKQRVKQSKEKAFKNINTKKESVTFPVYKKYIQKIF